VAAEAVHTVGVMHQLKGGVGGGAFTARCVVLLMLCFLPSLVSRAVVPAGTALCSALDGDCVPGSVPGGVGQP
jgi:hypothetical protein